MRRGLPLPCLALALGLGVAGAFPATAEDHPKVSSSVPGTAEYVGTIDARAAMARQRMEGRAAVPSKPRSLAPATDPPFSDPTLAQSPPATAGFEALPDSNTSIPPNTNGAVGPSHLMVTLNTQVRFQQKDGTPIGTPLALNFFWGAVNSGGGTEDPRVVFDPLGGKWVTAAVDDTGSATTGGILVGVSWTADPTGSWQLFKIPTAPAWPDRVSIGFNKNWVVVQANLYDGGGFVGSRVYAIEHSPLFTSTPPTLSYRSVDLAGALAVIPAATYGAMADQPPELYLLQTSNPTTGTLQLYKLDFADPAPNVQILPVGPVADSPVPVPWSDSAGPADFARQAPGPPGCTAVCNPDCRIQAGDSRIQNVVYRNGYLWAAHTVFLPAGAPERSSVQWWKIDPLLVSVEDRGLVDDPTSTRFFAYPTLAVNKDQDVLLGYSRFQGSEFAGASYSFRTAIDPYGTMQPERALRDGDACYYKDPASLGTNQWGAYSATVVDPADDKTLWTIQEHAANPAPTGLNPDRWGTWWGKLDPTPTIAITDPSVSEGQSGTTTLTFDVSLRSSDLSQLLATSQTVSVQFSTSDGTARTSDLDYEAVAATAVTFDPGQTVKTIEVTVNGDTKREGDETLFVDLVGAVNAYLPDNQARGTILNDDPVPQISINDVQVLEGDSGTRPQVFTMTLSNPSDSIVSITYEPLGQTATVGTDVALAKTSVDFPAGTVSQTVTAQVMGDVISEIDETYLVILSAPVGVSILKGQGTGTIIDDDQGPTPPVTSFAVVSDGDSTYGRNRLQWLNPDVSPAPQGVRIRYNYGSPSCSPPTDPGGGAWGSSHPDGWDFDPVVPGAAQTHTHGNLALAGQYCYAAWAYYGGTSWSPSAVASGWPFDASIGPLKWKHYLGGNPGYTTVAPPSVGLDGVLVPSNDYLLHGMVRGAGGGLWPGPWRPFDLGALAQARSPIVPFASGSRAFISDQSGLVRAIDTSNGALVWARPLPEGKTTAAPAGIFLDGGLNYILVGTSRGGGLGDHFYALDPQNGNIVDTFPAAGDGVSGQLGEVLGMATVDYATSRVYFASRRGTASRSLWCLELGSPPDALRPGWSIDLGADVEGSPVLRGGRIYVGDVTNAVWSVSAATGTGGYNRSVGTSRVEGFLFPDRSSGDLYAATSSEIVALTDNGSALSEKWSPIGSIGTPSIVLLQPGTTNLYAGASSYLGNARLLRINAATGSVISSVVLDVPGKIIGAPSLDIGVVPPMIYVGSDGGVLYAVDASF